MAQEMVMKRWCDVHLHDRAEYVEGVTFQVGSEGKVLAIELCDECTHFSFSSIVDHALEYGRPAEAAPAKKKKKAATPVVTTEPTSAEIRAWCRENNVEVSRTGQVSNKAITAYMEAHQ